MKKSKVVTTPAKTFKKYGSILLDIAIDKPLDYGIPDELTSLAEKGSRVAVTVRGKKQLGYVVAIKDSSDYSNVLPIQKVISDEELISGQLFQLALWMSSYYCTPLRQVLKVILPASVRSEMSHKEQFYVARAKTREELAAICIELRNKFPAQAAVLDVMLQVKKGLLLTELLEATGGSRSPIESLAKKGLLAIDIVRIDRSPFIDEEYFLSKPKLLNEEQQNALDKIVYTLSQNQFASHLLFGITGSGKTEVYLQAIAKALEQNKGTIMLVPEIALTAQTIDRFRSRFDSKIAILHHRLSQGERFDEWHRLRRGEALIAIGARSAIFSPIKNLGLIIVDEEHESSYKQNEEQPCYHARDVAVMRAKMAQACVILGSATPSLESFYNCTVGKYNLSELKQRPQSVYEPKITIVDMRIENEKAQGFTNFSSLLLKKIKEKSEAGEQTILFLNRRGYHTSLICPTCQTALKCAHCDLSLTFHKNEQRLCCHLCGYSITPPPKHCTNGCGEVPLKFQGVGTQQIEKSLFAIYPHLHIVRLDADTTRHKGSHQKLLKEFGSGKADVLIGTQMIAKGLHFPSVTLVGILNSEAALHIPDFRSSEICFQLITQVAGRAGRGLFAGEVVIQTFLPENSTILHSSQNNYAAFYHEEMATRKLFNYPPYCQLGKVVFAGKEEKKTEEYAKSFYELLSAILPKGYEINPVLPSAYAKIKDNYRFQFFIKGSSAAAISQAIAKAQAKIGKRSSVKVTIDINPSSTYF